MIAIRFGTCHANYVVKACCVNMCNDLRVWIEVTCKCYWIWIDQSHKSHDASDKYPIMHHFVTEMCTFLLQNGALWDMEMVHCGICATGLLNLNWRWKSSLTGDYAPYMNLNLKQAGCCCYTTWPSLLPSCVYGSQGWHIPLGHSAGYRHPVSMAK